MAGNAKKQPEKPAETDSKKSTSTRFLMFRFSPEKRGAAIKVFIAGVLALLMFSQVISSYMQLNEVYSSISDANSELSNLRSENVRLPFATSRITRKIIWGSRNWISPRFNILRFRKRIP